MLRPPFLRASCLERPEIRHGFFGRQGGVSKGPYASLQCGPGAAGDKPERIARNRALAVEALGHAAAALVSVKQVHSAKAAIVTEAWAPGQGPEADAMATNRPGLALGILTADCAPVLFADRRAGVVGAAHAGWRGAFGGVLEATIEAMIALGAEPGRIRAAIGPCIAQRNYQVSPDFRARLLAASTANEAFFIEDFATPDHWRFDLTGYCEARLKASGLGEIESLDRCTYGAADVYFSNRRSVAWGEADYGRQISIIGLAPEG